MPDTSLVPFVVIDTVTVAPWSVWVGMGALLIGYGIVAWAVMVTLVPQWFFPPPWRR